MIESLQHFQKEESAPTPLPDPRPTASLALLDSLHPYFDLNHQEFAQRLSRSFTPWKRDFIEICGAKPDLYGPVWIVTTAAFLLAFTGNLARYFNQQEGKDEFSIRLHYLSQALLVLYGFGFTSPLILTFLLRHSGGSIQVLNCFCLYGYSLASFIPAMALCVYPSNLFQWVSLLCGTLNSGGYLVLNIQCRLPNNEYRHLTSGFLISAQTVLLLVFKLKFYDISYSGLDK